MNRKRDPFETVLQDAGALRDAAIVGLERANFSQTARRIGRAFARRVYARSLTPLAIAGGLGFIAGSVIGR